VKLPFSEFLSYLHRQGFIIGVDHHLRLQTLLNKLGPDCMPDDLRYLLCPIFATNPKQQQQFYRAFDSYFNSLQSSAAKQATARPTSEKTETKKPAEPIQARKWPYIVPGAVLILLVAIFSHWQPNKPTPAPEEKVIDTQPAIQDSSTTRTDSTDIGLSMPQPAAPEDAPVERPVQRSSAAYEVLRTWAARIDSLNRLNRPRWEPTFYQRHWLTIRRVALLAPVIILLLTEWYRFNRRRLILQKQRGKKPPFVWQILIETPALGFLRNEQFYTAARQLRHRLESEVVHLDINKTVSKTIASAGFPDFQYKPFTRPPEYLVLIDRPTPHDHHAHLFEDLVRELENEGLFIHCYFYENDPRVCFRDPSQERVLLSELQGRFGDNRLLIFGAGDGLIDPVSGNLDRWTSIFHAWHDRAILTSTPASEWGRREIVLAHDFIVLPASLDGIAALVDHFDMPEKLDLKSWKQNDLALTYPKSNQQTEARALRQALGEEAFQWLCACAVYPELYWDLTLYLGALPSMPENLITEENMLRLLRLPWFRTGTIPDELRWELISELNTEKSQAIRAAIIELLEKNPAPEESFAYDAYHLNLVVQKWMLSRKSRKQRQQMLATLQSVQQTKIIQDYTLLRFLESAPKFPLSLVLPRRLRKIFYKNGIPIFGLKFGVKAFLNTLLIILAYLILQEPTIPVNLELRNNAAVNGAILDKTEKNILTWSTDGSISLWDAKNGHQVGQAMKHKGSVLGAVFDQQGKRILSWSGDTYISGTDSGEVRLWNAETGNQIGQTMKHRGSVFGAVFDRQGKRILSWSGDIDISRTDSCEVRLWDAEIGRQLGQTIKHEGNVWGAMFDKQEKRILSWSADSTIRLWDAETGHQLGQTRKHAGSVWGAVLDQQGNRILSWSGDTYISRDDSGEVRLWDTETGRQLGQTIKHKGDVNGAAFDQQEKRILTWSDDGTACLWEVETGHQIGQSMRHEGVVWGAVFDKQEKRILTWSEDYTARLWEIETTRQVGESMKHKGGVLGAVFDKHEKRILTWSEDGSARLWEAETERQIGQSLKHEKRVRGAVFDKHEKRILTWSSDGTAKFVSIKPFLTDSAYFGTKFTQFPELVPLRDGAFLLGSRLGEKDSFSSERPQHEVTLAPFAIGKHEITNTQFVQFLADSGNRQEGGGSWLLINPQFTKIKQNSSREFLVEKGFENYPVVGVSWYGAMAYCRWLTQKTGIPFRLPTEAEWEYTCRAGTTTAYSFGGDSTNYDQSGWFINNSSFGPHEVGQKLPNDFGLYDMHGNLWEWCLDAWRSNYQNAFADGRAIRPQGRELRVVRGGSWYDPVWRARSANRYNYPPILDINLLVGFRVVTSQHGGYTTDEISGFQELQPGFELLEETVQTGKESFLVKIVRVDQSRFGFRILGRDSATERAYSLYEHQQRTNAVCVLNGGFRLSFETHEPTGLVIIDKRRISPFAKSLSGIIAIKNQRVEIIATPNDSMQQGLDYALQGNPMLVNQGRVTQLQPQDAPRAFVALDQEDRVILGIASWVSSLELARYLARKDGLNCVNALNLEGGNEGLFIKIDGFEREYRNTRREVPNAVAIFQKQSAASAKR